MLNIEKSSLILILIIVVLIAGFVSLVTLGYTPGSVWHKAEDVKAGTFGNNVGQGNYNFPGNVGIKTPSPSSTLDVTGNIYATGQVTAGTKFHVGSSDLSSSELKVNNNSLVVTTTGNVGIGTTNPQAKLEVNGNIVAARPTTPDQLATKGYVDEVVGIVTGELPLINAVHTQKACINAGGEAVDTDESFKQCRFNAESCPSGWTQYKNYSTTTGKTCTVSNPQGPCTVSCYSGEHTWSNRAQEACTNCTCHNEWPDATYCRNDLPGCAEWCDDFHGQPCRIYCCWSTITQIGCY